MDEYGAEISQQGIPVSQASDDQKVLDTRWKTLDIFGSNVFNTTVTLSTNATGGNLGFTTQYFVLYSHNLGYLPAFDYEINSISISDGSALANNILVVSDSNNVYLVPQIGSFLTSLTLTITITVQVYALDITTYFQAPTIQAVSTNNPTTSNYGVEFVNPTLAAPLIGELPVAEYNFSTRLKPLNILQNGTVATSNGSISINYNYPNNPIYLLAQYFPNGYNTANISIGNSLVGSLSFQGGRGTISSTTITVNGVQSNLIGSFTYILLKDPIGLIQ
jgi:hypothetical protein